MTNSLIKPELTNTSVFATTKMVWLKQGYIWEENTGGLTNIQCIFYSNTQATNRLLIHAETADRAADGDTGKQHYHPFL